MADKSKIQWTEATWNPVIGCARVSEGCRNCYAEVQAKRIALMHQNSAYSRVLRHDHDGFPLPRWNGAALPMPDRLDQPLRWAKPRLIFVNSMSDLFHQDVPFEYIAAVFGVMAATPRHTFQVLTKRPMRALEFFQWLGERPGSDRDSRVWWCAHHAREQGTEVFMRGSDDRRPHSNRNVPLETPWPLPNVWLGVSCENQEAADERIPVLLECPAAVRWVSYEPALGPVRFRNDWLLGTFKYCPDEALEEDADPCRGCAGYSLAGGDGCGAVRGPRLDWIVVGGESGPGARTCRAEWLRSIVYQCLHAGVPVFVKQLGAAYEDPENGIAGPALARSMDADTRTLVSRVLSHPKGGDIEEWPERLRVREWPTKDGAP